MFINCHCLGTIILRKALPGFFDFRPCANLKEEGGQNKLQICDKCKSVHYSVS